MTQQAHYSSTTEMLNAFFSKPLTLILAITFAFSALVQVLAPLLTGGSSSFDVFSICFAIGFFLLYFKAKSQNPFTDFKAPLTLIKVTAIIFTCLVGVCTLMIALCIPMLSTLDSLMPSFVSTLRLLLIASVALMIFYFIYNLGFAIFAGSMKKTYKENTVKRSGSVFTGVTGITYIIACVGFVFVIILMAELIISAFTEIFTLFLEESFASSSDITFTSLSTTSNTLTTDYYSSDITGTTSDSSFISILVAPCALLLNILMTSIYALCYNGFMKNAAENFIPAAPSAPASNAGTASSFGFSPKPTYPGQSYASSNTSYGTPNRNNYGGPAVPATMNYSRALAPEIHFGDEFNSNEDRRICPTCGSKVELALDFCPQCGFKFIIQEEKPVENIPEPTPAEPVAEAVTPVEAPVAEPIQTPVVEAAPIAEPIQTPVVEATPVAEPVPTIFNSNIHSASTPVVEPVAPVQNVVRKEPTIAPEQSFVAPFQTVDTTINQPSVSEQPLVTPFFNSNTQPARNKSKSNDEPKPFISNSNLKR